MPDPVYSGPDPVIPPGSPLPPPARSVSNPELRPNIAAALACFFSVLGGIIFLALEKKNRFVRFYAMQSLLFGLAWFLLFFSIEFMASVLGRLPLLGKLFEAVFWLALALIGFLFFAVWIVTIVNAFKNKEWEIPYIGQIARKQLISGPLSRL